jgi:hypothetical protein
VHSHYLVEPVACTPASGWEKGQVENQVGLVRERFFTLRLRFKTYDEMNAWLRRRLNMSAGGPSAARAIAIAGLPLIGASSNFGMGSWCAHRRGDNLHTGAYNVKNVPHGSV